MRLLELLYFYLFCCNCISSQLNINHLNLELNNVQLCVKTIYSLHFDLQAAVTIIDENRQLDSLVKHLNLINLINPLKADLSTQVMKDDHYILSLTEANCEQIIKQLIIRRSWNPSVKIIIIYEGQHSLLLKILFKYLIFNVVVLIKNIAEVNVYTYFPYRNLHTKIKPQFELLVKCRNGELLENVTLFPNKKPNHWNNFPLEVLAMKFPPFVACKNCERNYGIEITLLEILQERLRFKISYIDHNYTRWGVMLKNETFTDAYGSLQNNEADVGVGFFVVKANESCHFDTTVPYLDDPVVWVVPAPQLLKRWKNISGVYNNSIVIFMIIALGITSILTYILSQFTSESKYFQNFSETTLKFFSCLLGVSVDSQPRSTVLRCIFFAYVLHSLIISVAFQSDLIKSLSQNHYSKSLENVNDIIDSGIKIGIFPELINIYANSNNTIDKYIFTHAELCDTRESCLEQAANQRNIVTGKSRLILANTFEKYINLDGDFTILTLKDRILMVRLSMVFTKGHPIFDKANDLLLNIKEAGIVTHLIQSTFYSINLILNLKKRFPSSTTLHLEDVTGIFIILIVGWIISSFVFITEILAPKNIEKRTIQ